MKMCMKKKTLISIIIFIFFSCSLLFSQEKGEPVPQNIPDSTYVFTSPRPLVSIAPSLKFYENAWGLNMLLSNFGYALGIFYEKRLNQDLALFLSLYLTGARKTDEREMIDRYGNYVVPYKINRLYVFPLMVGVQQNVFSGILGPSFKPYVEAGLGPSFIVSTPYDRELFNSFKYAQGYTRFGAFLGIGANFSPKGQSIFGLNLRYYYIPFGGNGLESVIDQPLTDFGGLFLSLNIGSRF